MNADVEPIAAFRERVREWLARSMPRLSAQGYLGNPMASSPEDRFSRARELQRRLYDGGFAGLTFPEVAGGQDLPFEYQATLVEEAAGYEMPLRFTMPTLGIIGATIVDFGTAEQQRRFIPPMLRGDNLWVQLLSEPSCGSDLAGVRTRAVLDGDVWRIDGEKVWSSAAYGCDWGLCLVRTDWSVAKHAGLTMIAIDLRSPRLDIRPIRQVDGSEEFCSVHFDGVEVPSDNVIGDVNGGWKVASALMGHERDSVGGGSRYIGNVHIHSVRRGAVLTAESIRSSPSAMARRLAAERHVNAKVGDLLVERTASAAARGLLNGPAGALLRLYSGTRAMFDATAALDLAGMDAVVFDESDSSGRDVGIGYVRRQANCLAGGSNEMQRNLISERLLGMPREYAPDRDRPFGEVPVGPRNQ